jgi:hypothetical protein
MPAQFHDNGNCFSQNFAKIYYVIMLKLRKYAKSMYGNVKRKESMQKLKNKGNVFFFSYVLEQRSQTRGPLKVLVRPATSFIIYKTVDSYKYSHIFRLFS